MEMQGNTLTIVLLVVGLVVGAGAGYFLAPVEYSEENVTPVEPVVTEIVSYKPSTVSYVALFIAILSAGYDVLQETRFQKWKNWVNGRLEHVR